MGLHRLGVVATTDPASGAGQPPGPGPQDSQQPEQPAPDGTTGVSGGGSGSSGCTKGCLGCGCLLVVGLVILALVGGWFAWQTPQAVGADDWGELFEMAEGMQEAAERADRAADGEMASPEPHEVQDAAKGFDLFFNRLEETELSSRDVNRIRGELEQWKETEEVEEFYELLDSLESLEDEESALQQLMGVRSLVRLLRVSAELGEHYLELEQSLGDEFSQLNAIVRVAQMGSGQEFEPWAQSVADALLEDHEEHAEDYREARELLRKVVDEETDPEDLSEEQQRKLAEAYSEHLVLITAALNRDSLQAWAGLSDDEREQLVELVDDKHMWIGRYSAAVFHIDEERGDLFFLRMAGL